MAHNSVYRLLISAALFLALTACSYGNKNIQLVKAAQRGNSAEVEKLIRAGADVNSADKSGLTPYTAASANGHIKTMMVLEKAGARKLPLESDVY